MIPISNNCWQLRVTCMSSHNQLAPPLNLTPPHQRAPRLPAPPSRVPTSSSLPCTRFAPPKTDVEIAREREKGIPKKTLEDTKYCLKLWEEWRRHRQQTTYILSACGTKLTLYNIPVTFGTTVIKFCAAYPGGTSVEST